MRGMVQDAYGPPDVLSVRDIATSRTALLATACAVRHPAHSMVAAIGSAGGGREEFNQGTGRTVSPTNRIITAIVPRTTQRNATIYTTMSAQVTSHGCRERRA